MTIAFFLNSGEIRSVFKRFKTFMAQVNCLFKRVFDASQFWIMNNL